MDEFLTTKDAAQLKGVSIATIYKAIEEKRLPSTRVLGRIAIKPADLEAYEPGSYGGVERTRKRRGPKKREVK